MTYDAPHAPLWLFFNEKGLLAACVHIVFGRANRAMEDVDMLKKILFYLPALFAAAVAPVQIVRADDDPIWMSDHVCNSWAITCNTQYADLGYDSPSACFDDNTLGGCDRTPYNQNGGSGYILLPGGPFNCGTCRGG